MVISGSGGIGRPATRASKALTINRSVHAGLKTRFPGLKVRGWHTSSAAHQLLTRCNFTSFTGIVKVLSGTNVAVVSCTVLTALNSHVSSVGVIVSTA